MKILLSSNILFSGIVALTSLYSGFSIRDRVGALVTLVKGENHGDFYLLVRRNKSIYQFFWNKNSTDVKGATASNPDVVLFHESSLTESMRNYIQAQTPELPLKFIYIQFDGFAKFNNISDKSAGYKQVYENCHPTGWSNSFKIGYKNMCRFWFIGFLDYLREYDWMLRLDPDCEFEEDSRDSIPPAQNVFISSPAWLPLHHQRFDKISTTYDGEVVKGMGPFVREFIRMATEEKLPKIDSWHAPYTNAMFMNLSMLYANNTLESKLIWKFLQAVDDSNCIYSNRWGDMPLWGAVLGFLNHSVHFSRLSYYHWSHKTLMNNAAKSGRFRNDIPVMLVYADHNSSHPTINARVVSSR